MRASKANSRRTAPRSAFHPRASGSLQRSARSRFRYLPPRRARIASRSFGSRGAAWAFQAGMRMRGDGGRKGRSLYRPALVGIVLVAVPELNVRAVGARSAGDVDAQAIVGIEHDHPVLHLEALVGVLLVGRLAIPQYEAASA